MQIPSTLKYAVKMNQAGWSSINTFALQPTIKMPINSSFREIAFLGNLAEGAKISHFQLYEVKKKWGKEGLNLKAIGL